MYQGNVNSSIIRPGEIFKEPVRLNSAAIILAHNNPSYFTISRLVAQEGKRWYDAFTATVYTKRRQRDANGAKTHTGRGADG